MHPTSGTRCLTFTSEFRRRTSIPARRTPHPPARAMAALAVLVTLLAVFTGPALGSTRPPNVILIFTDDQGYGDVGCFGAKGFATPNLDRLAKEGVRFTDFYVSSAVCSASRAALLTGSYHGRVGIHGALGPGSKIGLHPDETTIDLLPTLATLAGAPLPPRRIDGLDIWPLLACEKGARSPHPAYFTWYANNQLQAVRSGEWKLVLPHNYRTLAGRPGGQDGLPAKYGAADVREPELYHLTRDRGESKNVAAQHPEVVQRLLAFATQARAELGDSLTKQKGTGGREAGTLPP